MDGQDHLLLDGRRITVRYRGNSQARRIIMRMEKDGQGVVLTVPPGVNTSAAHDFAVAQTPWIWQRLAPEQEQEPAERLSGTTVLVRGIAHEIEISAGRGVPVYIRDLPKPCLVVRGDEAHMQRRITDFLKREARKDLETASRQYAEAMALTYKQLSVRDTTTRWGSCSTSGTLSYSWRLVLAPPRVLDYVCAHEVAHLEQMNHGPKFWELVYRHCPHTEYGRKWLRKNGHTLHKLPV